MKKLLVTMLIAVFCLTAVFAFVGCGAKPDPDSETKTFDILVWCSEIDGVSELFEQQIKDFNESNGQYTINATVNKISESEAATQMIADVETGADIYCFAQDQLNRLVQVNALSALGKVAKEAVIASNDASAVAAATVGDTIYCYPLTSDNGYYMYYDKSVVSADHLDDIDAILADCVNCESGKRTFNMDILGSGWYNAAFFFGTGCVSSWATASDGSFNAVNDTYNSDAGLIAMKGMQSVLQSPAFNSSSEATEFGKGAAVVVAGPWCANAVKAALGDNYGVAKLPKFTVDGQSYQLGSYSGNKLLGVKPTKDLDRANALQALATYLTNAKCQLERFNAVGWGPSNIEAQANPAVVADPALVALAQQNEYAKPQGQIPGAWWDVTTTLAAAARDAKSEDDLRAALVAYDASVKAMANGTYVPDTDIGPDEWALIGNIFGDTWNKDIALLNIDGIWTSNPLKLNKGEEFKARKGSLWDESIGKDGGNVVVDEDGTYVVRVDVANQEITMTAVTSESWSLIGGIYGDEWSFDIPLTEQEDGLWVSGPLKLNEGEEFKARKGADWNGSEFGSADGNFKVDATDTYIVKVDTVNKTITLESASVE